MSQDANAIDRKQYDAQAQTPCPLCETPASSWYCGTPGALGIPGIPNIQRCRLCNRFDCQQAAQEAHDVRVMVLRSNRRAMSAAMDPFLTMMEPLEPPGPGPGAELGASEPVFRVGQGDFEREADVTECVRWLVMLACVLAVIAAVVAALT